MASPASALRINEIPERLADRNHQSGSAPHPTSLPILFALAGPCPTAIALITLLAVGCGIAFAAFVN